MRILALLLLLVSPGGLFAQANVLIIDFNNGFNSDQSNNQSRVYSRLLATQNSVTRVNTVPATISNAVYDQVWCYGNPGTLNATYVNRLVNFINGGGSVYIQSEVSCCTNMASLFQAVMQAAVAGGGSMTHNPNKGTYYRFTTGAAASCPGITHYGAAVRVYVGVPAQNHLFTALSGCSSNVLPGDAAGVFFRSCDMVGGQGGLVSAGDFNMFMSSSTCSSVGLIGSANRNDLIDLIANLMGDLVNCGTCGIVLPVEYGNFSVEAVEDKVHIDWTTLSESNNASFTVERSADGGLFNELKTIPGAGESSQEIDYRVIDSKPLEGVSYYRLKQTDLNGRETYSEIKSVRFGGWGGLNVYQVESDDHLVVENLPENLSKCELLTATGQLVGLSGDLNGSTMVYETSSLSPGIYLVRVTTKTSRQIVKKVMILE